MLAQNSRHRLERERIEEELDRQLEQTFPGSDPLTITRSAPGHQITPRPAQRERGPVAHVAMPFTAGSTRR